jgi:hydroxymethylglutaryl-CoA reductase
MKIIEGFSKLNREQKMDVVLENQSNAAALKELLNQHLHPVPTQQEVYNSFSENTLSNHYMPFGIAPNFIIDNEYFFMPMVVEESSVVAAASSAAGFWARRGGFKTSILGTEKSGQVYFTSLLTSAALQREIADHWNALMQKLNHVVRSMKKRGGGITGFKLMELHDIKPGTYKLHVTFQTADAMGANFINTCLEKIASGLQDHFQQNLHASTESFDVVMCILSNNAEQCRVVSEVSCSVSEMCARDIDDPSLFTDKFLLAAAIAANDPDRAVTHNKGIYNGIDAVVLATGNDYRAVEACGHAFASSGGRYRALSTATVQHGTFNFRLEVPMALGTVGGLTSLHPMARLSLELLGNPGADKLMRIVASAGLASNFSALRALVTTGIQQGHMKMHLSNLLFQVGATTEETYRIKEHFRDRPVSANEVRQYLKQIRKTN